MAASTLPLSDRVGVSVFCETLGNAAPVEKTPYHRFDVVSSAVLPVEIVGVFPDIDNRKRCDTCAGDRRFGVWCAYDGQFSVFQDKPCPTAAKTFDRRIGQCILACAKRTEGGIYGVEKFRRGRCVLSFRRESLPVECMIS